MNSPKSLNYETRPAKFTERKMLLASLQRICNQYANSYQYIGMGGLSFTDFKLFHKELHIDEMYSIEGGSFSYEKLTYNSPYDFINIIKDQTTSALGKIDLTKKTIAWLDYDGTLKDYMFEDLSLLISKLPIGSVYLMSCNRELKNDETGDVYDLNDFIEKFGDLSPFGLKQSGLTGSEDYLTIRTMMNDFIEKLIKDRNRTGDNIAFQQLFNFTYQESRGARMFTFGGVITSKDEDFESLGLSDLPFISNTEIAYKLNIPNITNKEIDLINKESGTDVKKVALIAKNIVGSSDIDKYKAVYKYLPTFFDVRL